jgi:hypothetical protein
MALGTLAELRNAALDTRTDQVGRFGDFLALAEQRMYYGSDGVAPLRVLPMETTVDLTFTDGVATLPSDYLDRRAVYWEGAYTVSLSYEPPSVFYPMSRAREGGSYPSAYTVEGNTIKISPELTGTAKMLYFARAAALSSDPATNVILAKWPGVYLFGCQIELYRVLRDDAEMVKAMRMYADAVNAANNQTIAARTYGGPLKRRVGFGV